jgi:hypothetical protein
MRIFVLGAGATGSLLAQLLERQGHDVWCGDREPERAKRFLGKKAAIPVIEVNARNLWAIVRAARGAHLIVNASPAVFNTIVLRAALRLRAHYLDMASHLGRYPFKAEQVAFHRRFLRKNRAALFNAGAAPGLTNLLVARSAEMLDAVDAVRIRLYESSESEDPISQWSAEEIFNEAVARPRVYREGRFRFGQRFGERELFRFLPPIGEVPVFLAAQDEVVTLPRSIPMRSLDEKIGGNEFERLRRLYRRGKIAKGRGMVPSRFPKTPTPRQVARLIRQGVLQNARFAAAVVVSGTKGEFLSEIRWDAVFPSLYQIRQRGLYTTPIAWATAHLAALFVKHFPREFPGVHPPELLPAEIRQAILADARSRDIQLAMKMKTLPAPEEEE